MEVIRRFALRRPGNADVTLVSPDRYTPYSGMLPGFIAGHYRFEECHIDLEPLCARAGMRFRRAEARELRAETGSVRCSDGSEFGYDLLSLDTGSTPDVHSIAGALQHGIRVKPVNELLDAWKQIGAELRRGRSLCLAVVGGGAGGVELAAALHYRWKAEAWTGAMRLSVLTETESLLPAHPARVQRIFQRAFRNRGIELRLNARVTRISPGQLKCADGTSMIADHTILATGASAPAWLAEGGLNVDDRGFVAVDDSLRSLSHPNVFAAGDIAAMISNPRPKTGVYAVRQGPILAENLGRQLRGDPLCRYLPQKTALALISTGGKHAVASWSGIAFEGDWVWRWKDHVDRRFMATYRARTT